jgi:Ca2+-binding EF-hand superfamily protein
LLLPPRREVLRRIATDASPPDFSSPPWPSLSAAARQFTAALLTRDPRARLTAAAALSHPWLRAAAADAVAAVPLDASVLTSLRVFHAGGRARRAALRALAATFAPGELLAASDQFAALDADADGAVSRDELRAALQRGGSGVGDAEVEAIFRDLDAAHAGSLRFSDFAAGALRVAQLRRADAGQWAQHVTAAFEALDADADGFLTAQDLARQTTTDADDASADAAAAAALLAEADADGDGRVGLADFEALLRRSASGAMM